MKLFKNKIKKIKFYSDKTHLDLLKPIPTSKSVPDWYRKMPGSIGGIETVKKCVPVLDSITSGYVIPLPADVVWDEEAKRFITQGKFQINSDHYIDQIHGIPIPEEYDNQPHKWVNSWYVKTPPGYSTLFVHPLNRLDLPFYSFSGIVDTDEHPIVVNFPFVFRKDFRGIVPAGTPMIQAIPFKRDDWQSEVFDTGDSYFYDKHWEVELPPFSWYKRHWWKRKRYS
jgi:hypothetical protein